VKRVLAFPIVRLVLIVMLFGALAVPVTLAIGPSTIWRTIFINWALVLLLLAAIVVVEWFAAGRTPKSIGFDPRFALRDIVLGCALGMALFSIVVLELRLAGYYRVEAVHASWDVAIAALLLLGDAIIEELLFRGILFRLVEEWAGTWIALAVSAAMFGIAHAANPGATWFSSIAIAVEAGVLLGAAFVVTRNLWFPIGLHFAWNFFEGPVYGTQISGHVFLKSMISANVTGSPILTGGRFGPEAGLFAIAPAVVAAVGLLVYAKRTGLIVRPAWRQRARPTSVSPVQRVP
jgi:membrane protease YdiL (CAAX protease family)